MIHLPNELFTTHSPHEAELIWQNSFRDKTPMGILYKDHSMYSRINHGKDLLLIHVTTLLDDIEKDGFMFASGGCLGASIYVVPLETDDTLHNLSDFILNYEVPLSLKAQNKPLQRINIIAIEIPQKLVAKSNTKKSGFDYLTLGGVQAKILKQLLDLHVFSKRDVVNIKKATMRQLHSCNNLFSLSEIASVKKVSPEHYFSRFDKCLDCMPFLGYIYFEVLLECISLLQNDTEAIEYRGKGQLYNGHFKKMVFELSPGLLKGFKLIHFKPSLSKVIDYLREKSKDGKIFNNFDETSFAELVKFRVAQTIMCKVLGGKYYSRNWEFEELVEENADVIGHIFHKVVREMPDLSQQHFLYEEIKAEVIWNRWNQEKILCPYNSIVPKGEMGINPRYPGLSYKVYIANIDSKTNKLTISRETNIKIAPKLINPSISLMGAPQKLPFNI